MTLLLRYMYWACVTSLCVMVYFIDLYTQHGTISHGIHTVAMLSIVFVTALSYFTYGIHAVVVFNYCLCHLIWLCYLRFFIILWRPANHAQTVVNVKVGINLWYDNLQTMSMDKWATSKSAQLSTKVWVKLLICLKMP